MLTQTALNSSLERCRILQRTHPHDVDIHTLLNIRNFFTKIRSLGKTNCIAKPTDIEPNSEHRGIQFDWVKVTPEGQVDTLEIIFTPEDYFIVNADYPSLETDIHINITMNEDFHERIIVHLRHFTVEKKGKRYKPR